MRIRIFPINAPPIRLVQKGPTKQAGLFVIFAMDLQLVGQFRHGFEQVGVYKEVGWKLEDWRDVSWWQLLL